MDWGEMERIQCLRKSGEMCQDEYRNKMVNWIIKLFTIEYNYKFVQELGCGGFGDVVEMLKPDGYSVAMKIILKEHESPVETEMWPTFAHRNIQPVMKVITIDSAEASVFIMPKQKTCLFECIRQRKVPESHRPLSLGLIKCWFGDVLRGMAYLHERKLCHLDMKIENVLISDDLSAVICDFTTIASTDKGIRRFGAPDFCRPPETCRSRSSRTKLDGEKFDMWTFGMLALNLFTGNSLRIDVPNADDWSAKVYPQMFRVLEDENFKALINLYLPSLGVNKAILKSLMNFIFLFLRVDPHKRPSAKFALEHEFLERGNVNIQPDAIWIEKVSSESIKVAVELYATLKNINPKSSPNTDEISEKRTIVCVEEAIEQKDLTHVAAIYREISEENDGDDILCSLKCLFHSAGAPKTPNAASVSEVDQTTFKVCDDWSGIQNKIIKNVPQIEIIPNLSEKENLEIEAEFKEKQNVFRSADLSIKSKFTTDIIKHDEKMTEIGKGTRNMKPNTGETAASVKENMENESTGPQRRTVGRMLRGCCGKCCAGFRNCVCCCQQSPTEN